MIEKHCAAKGFDVLHWRDVPTDNSTLGPSSLACEPMVKQLFVAPKNTGEKTFQEVKLSMINRENAY